MKYSKYEKYNGIEAGDRMTRQTFFQIPDTSLFELKSEAGEKKNLREHYEKLFIGQVYKLVDL